MERSGFLGVALNEVVQFTNVFLAKEQAALPTHLKLWRVQRHAMGDAKELQFDPEKDELSPSLA
ncbi:hypothetical protein D3C71_2079150 [compost metagenome]